MALVIHALSELGWSKSARISAGAVLVAAVVFKALHDFKQLKTPPGPKGLPILGSVLDIPTETPWLVYKEWAERYGDIIYFEALGQRFLVLNSLSSINNLLAARASNYSNRVASPIIELMGHAWSITVMDYGQRWKDIRRTFHRFFNQAQVHQFRPVIEEEIPTLLRNLVEHPKEFRHFVHMFFGTVIMRVSYGSEEHVYNESLIEEADLAIQGMLDSIQPGKLLVGLFHSMRHIPSWFPGAGWRRKLERLTEMNEDLRTRPFLDTKARMKSGTQSDRTVNLATELIEELPDEDHPDYVAQQELAKDVAGISYLAGADTTISSALAVFFALAKHPEIQRKAQAEIEEVVGGERLPTFGDVDKLPYLQAIVKEVSRWHSVTPLALPHVSEKEDIFNGYRIPAGTLIFPNTWAAMHDPNVFEDPLEFKPERYLKDGQIDPSVLDPEAAAFGYGRRICPGRHLSGDSLTLMTACLLACFDIRPPVDEIGNPAPPTLHVTSTIISTPLPFEIEIKPRSQRYVDMLNLL